MQYHYYQSLLNTLLFSVPCWSFSIQSKCMACPRLHHNPRALLWYSHHSESSEPGPPFWALGCHCRDKTMFCLHPSLQYRVSTRKMPECSLLTHFWLWKLLSLQLLRPMVIYSYLAEHCCVFYCIHKLWSIRGKQVLVFILLPVLFI